MSRVIRPLVYPRHTDAERLATARAANALREALEVFRLLQLIDAEDVPRVDVMPEPDALRGSCGAGGMLVVPGDMIESPRGKHPADLVVIVDAVTIERSGAGDLLAVSAHVANHVLRPEVGSSDFSDALSANRPGRPDALHPAAWLIAEKLICGAMGTTPKVGLISDCPCRLVATRPPIAEEAR